MISIIRLFSCFIRSQSIVCLTSVDHIYDVSSLNTMNFTKRHEKRNQKKKKNNGIEADRICSKRIVC
jgi:hypothetical protein